MTTPEQRAACQHENFRCECAVVRIADQYPMVFNLEVTVQCTDCNERFVFQGLEAGADLNKPTMSVFGHEARLPIRPASQEYREVVAPSFRIRKQP